MKTTNQPASEPYKVSAFATMVNASKPPSIAFDPDIARSMLSLPTGERQRLKADELAKEKAEVRP